MANKKKNKTVNIVGETVLGTIAPTGLSLSRSGNKINASWNIGDENYGGGQTVRWYKNGVCVWEGAVDPGATSHSLNFNPDESIRSISISVQGCKGTSSVTASATKKNKNGSTTTTVATCYLVYAWSDLSWAEYRFAVPNVPSASFALDSGGYNKGTFSWSVDADDSSSNQFRRYEWQSIVVDNWNSTSPPSNWSGAETGRGYATSASWTKLERAALSDENVSYTRWFRVRSIGPGGTSAWRYAYHVYALPKAAENVSANITRRESAGYTCRTKWNAPNSFVYPCDKATVYYAEAIPSTTTTTVDGKVITDWTYPGTSSPSWTEAGTLYDTSGNDSLTFTIPNLLSEDECLWIRVDTKYDNHTTYGIPVLATGDDLGLKMPEITSFATAANTRRITFKVDRNTQVDNAFVAIHYRTADDPDRYQTIGLVKASQSGQSVTIQCPDWGETAVTIGAQCYLADYEPATPEELGTVTYYNITNVKMKSGIAWYEKAVPLPPKNVVLTPIGTNGIHVAWDWTWSAADHAELSWAQNSDAWESTAQPSTFELTDLYDPKWNIVGLEVGTWYVRVRLGKTVEGTDNTSWSCYSNPVVIKLSSAPATPSLILSQGAGTLEDVITCYWAYVSTDGTAQMHAELCEATWNAQANKYEYGEPFARTQSEQHISFAIADRGWEVGTTHYIAVRVTSASGETSEGWSSPVAVNVVMPITAEITASSLEEQTLTDDSYVLTADSDPVEGKTYYELEDDTYTAAEPYALTEDEVPVEGRKYYEKSGLVYTETVPYALTEDVSIVAGKDYFVRSETEPYVYTLVEDPVVEDIGSYYDLDLLPSLYDTTILQTLYEQATRTVLALTEMPMSVTVAGAGYGSQTSLIIDRAEDFRMRRPDESDIDGYKGETILSKTFDNDGIFEITNEDLIGYLDDRAPYTLTVIVKDSYGQTAETSLDFEVHWDHQAIVPIGEAKIDDEYDVAILKATVPAGATIEEGDVVDIYRLSVDAPQLIYEGAAFGEKYVDEYPTLGDRGGYRFVYRTYNGDYTTEDNRIAWYNTLDHDNEVIAADTMVIEFDGTQVSLPYGVTLSQKWKKDFTETHYLGGSVQGDWNPAVSRTASITTTAFDGDQLDDDTVAAMRRLAEWAGTCHVRTPEGSNFAANVDVSEERPSGGFGTLAHYTLDITRIDSPGLDGITYDEWLEKKPEEESA